VAELADAHTQILVASPNAREIFFPCAYGEHGLVATDLSAEPDVAGVIETVMDVKSNACGEPVSRHPVSESCNESLWQSLIFQGFSLTDRFALSQSRRRVKVYSMQRR